MRVVVRGDLLRNCRAVVWVELVSDCAYFFEVGWVAGEGEGGGVL